ncbi:DUF2868 domain-containing protein [Tsuneonella amylolytica]|uniref:DUF2868 domain-containing protein n=1 Tax=Tsuneonella amylolytica TaxID=2338327 RepID=UPI0013C46ECE|nr:DUF2868 domain-containing protein [Tsuneonella amylolytica]
MTEDEARQVELVRAIELEDRDGLLFTREDRDQADARARVAVGGGTGRRADARFVAARADFATTRIATRHPGIAGLLEKGRWTRWLAILLPLVALAAGLLANEFGTAKRLDLLAVPLLGTIAWNLLVYLWLAGTALTGRGHVSAVPLADLAGRANHAGRREFEAGTPIDRAALAFRRRWAALTAPLASARTARTLHLGAALFAAGLIAGIYGRALVTEYRAGWESTFLSAPAVHALLSTVLGPASALTGVAIPGVPGIEAMRWTGPQAGALGGGVNAGPWIHLYTVTMAALVIVPRLALTAWQGARALRLARTLPVAGRDNFYVRRLLRASGGRAGAVRVTPYAAKPGEETRRRLASALRAALGDSAEVRFDEDVAYGAEDGWLAAHPPAPDDDYHVLLFTLAATPEAENHGALARQIADALRRDHPGTVLAAIIDESGYRAHFAGQAGLEERVAQRLAAWRAVLGEAGVTPLGIDLSDSPDGDLAQKIERGLLPDAEMRR